MAIPVLSSQTPPSPDADQPQPGARKALTLLLAINLFNYIDRYVLSACLADIGRSMLSGDPHSEQKLGWLATAFLLSYMLLSPLFGWLADRFNRWVLVGIGVLLWSLASGESGRAGTYTILLITRLFVGVGEAAYGPAAPTIISDLYPIRVRGKVLSWFYLAIPVGSALGYGLGGLMVHLDAWRWAFYMVVPPGLLLGVLCFFMPNPVRGASDAVGISTRRSRAADYLTLLKNRSYVLNCLAMAALTFAIGGIAHWMPKYVGVFRKAGEEGMVTLIFGAITCVTGIVATLLGGIVGDRLRGKVRGSYFVVSAGGLLLSLPFFVAMLITPFPWAWIFVFLAEFWLFFNTGPSNTALANVVHPSIRSTAFAMNIFFIHALGDAISPPIIGYLTDKYHGNMNVGFAAVGVMIAVGFVLWWQAARFLDRDTAAAAGAVQAAR